MSVKTARFHYPQLLAYSILLGLLAGAVTVAFIYSFEFVQELLWTDLPERLNVSAEHALYPIIICGLGGLLLGILLKNLGNHPETIEEALAKFKKTKQFDYQHIWQAFVISIASLGFGAALGPEAALTAIVGGFVTLIGVKLHRASLLRYGAELDKKLSGEKQALLAFVAAGTGLLVFRSIGSSGYFDLGLPEYVFRVTDFFWLFVLVAVGAFVGMAYEWLDTNLEKALKPFREKQVILAATTGGLVLGLLAMLQPLALFSGHESLDVILSYTADETVWFFVGAVLIKILATSICLATGWKGGRFFPLMFAGATAGIALSMIFTTISPPFAMAVGMAATLSFVLKKPLIAGLLVAAFFPLELLFPSIAAAQIANTLAQRKHFTNSKA